MSKVYGTHNILLMKSMNVDFLFWVFGDEKKAFAVNASVVSFTSNSIISFAKVAP